MMMSIFSADNSTPPNVQLREEAENPLTPCPSSPNCQRRSYQIAANAEKIYPLLLKALHEMNAHDIEENSDKFTIEAVFKIFIYKDDVSIRLEAGRLQTLLHIRSASREGYYDFGVNKRRVGRFIKILGEKI